MSGMAGWMDVDRDLNEPGQRQVLQRMTDALEARGPDGSGLWTDTPVGLGYRHLAMEPTSEQQPVPVERDGRTVAVGCVCGHVDNVRELRDELSAAGHRLRSGGSAEVVTLAYLQWGEDFVSRLSGMYAVAIWDPRSQQLLLVRDRMGLEPLYYYPTAGGALFGSEPKAVLAHPEVTPVVDVGGLREILGFVKTPGHGIYRGLFEVQPGTLVRIRPEGMSSQRYWRLEAAEHTDDLDTTIATVRKLLDNTMARQLTARASLATLASGGLDSSAITALTATALASAGQGPVRSFAVDFSGHTENFTPDELRPTPDAPYVRELAEHLDTRHRDIVLSSDQLADRDRRAAVIRARDLPGMGDMDTSLHLLFNAIADQARVALSGESADEIFGGYAWFHDPAARDADTFPWLAAGVTHRSSPDHLLDPELSAQLDLPGFRDQAYRDALADAPELPGESGLQARMRQVSYLHLSRFLPMLLDRQDRIGMTVGLQVRAPLCDHRLVEYVFNTPWWMKTFDGREKSLLRAATSDLLPASISERIKSPYPATQDPEYDQALRGQLDAVAADPNAPVNVLIEPATTRELRDQPAGNRDEGSRRAVEVLLQLNQWLEISGTRLDL